MRGAIVVEVICGLRDSCIIHRILFLWDGRIDHDDRIPIRQVISVATDAEY